MKIFKLNVAALALAAAVISLPSCKGGSGQQQGQQAPVLGVMTVEQTDKTLETVFPAVIIGQNDVEIRPQVSGFLTKVHVDDGQHVSKGQVLFTIDQVQLQAAVDQAQAAVAVAQANVNTATTNANNNKILLDKNIISASAYQTSVDALNAAKAQLNQANASLTSARKNLSYTTVTAPVSGVVGEINLKEGTLVSPSTLLTVLSSNADVEAKFSFTEKEVLDMTQNGKRSLKEAVAMLPEVTMQLANGETYPFKGKIESVSGVLNQNTGSTMVTAVFPNPEGALHSGNTCNILIPTAYNGILTVPQNATYEIQDMRFVYVVGDSAKVHTRPIQVAPMNDGQNFIVTSGLTPGETIVTEGVGVSVQDGMTITPRAQSAAAPAAEETPAPAAE